jgi:hypothetical protein
MCFDMEESPGGAQGEGAGACLFFSALAKHLRQPLASVKKTKTEQGTDDILRCCFVSIFLLPAC